MPENRTRFVLLCQQALACATVVAVVAPATGVVELRIVAPPAAAGAPGAGAPITGAPITSTPITSTPATGAPTGGSLVSAEPVEPTIRTVPLAEVSVAGMLGLPAPSGVQSPDGAVVPQRISAISAPTRTTGYATVGVTWEHGVELTEDEITVMVRTKDDGVWSSWEEMHYDGGHGPDPGTDEDDARVRPGTDAVVVGDVDDVQVRAATADGVAPADLELTVVDPGVDTAPAYDEPAIDTGELPSARMAAAVSAAAGTPADVTPEPRIYSRSQWGADERLRDPSSLRYGEVHAGFVHHTVNANAYDREDVPAILRGIYAYHTRSLGWSDVGYNYLVDRFGRIWEGRYGGVDRPVVGAHTLGYNDDAFAMSAIGNFETARPSEPMLRAYQRLFAWKLSVHGVRADDGRQWVSSDWFPAVNGHRDAGQTACPGRYLYERIGDIRAGAARLQRPFTARTRTADLSGRSWPDLVVRDRRTHRMLVVRTGGMMSFLKGTVRASGWARKDLVAAGADLDGDGTPDLLARDARSGETGLYPAVLDGSALTATRTFDRFADLDQLTSVGDLDRDGHEDVVGREAASDDLLLFPGDGEGSFGRARRLSSDWSAYDLTAGADDLTGDGRPDLVARSGRVLHLVPGTRAGIGAPVALAGSFGGYDLLNGRGDATGDGHPDLVARSRRTGLTWILPGDGEGDLLPRIGGFDNYAGARWLALGGQITGSGRPELVGINGTSGELRVFPHNGRRHLGRTIDTGVVLDGVDLLLGVGDWNGDGHGDVMTRSRRSGSMWFRAGLGRNRFAAPVLAARGWSRVGLVAAVGDVTGDGFPDLMGRYDGGDLRVYPGDGSTGFTSSFVAHSAVAADSQAGMGLADADGAPDTLLRRSDGTLWLWSGNGPGGLTAGRQVGSGAGRYDWFLGNGDADGDGRGDVLARAEATGWLWLLPWEGAGFGERRLVGAGFEGYDLAG